MNPDSTAKNLDQTHHPRDMISRAAKWIVIGLIAIICFGIFISLAQKIVGPTVTLNASVVPQQLHNAVPGSATDINYYTYDKLFANGYVVDYLIPETDFIVQVNQSGLGSPQEISSSIIAYGVDGTSRETPPQKKTLVKSGLWLENRFPNNGGWLAVYDRQTGRAFFKFDNR